MIPSNTTVAKAAASYAAFGLSVIPLPRPPLGDGKAPRIEWATYQKRIAGADELGTWFGNGADTNIGIVCGQVSGGLVVLDCDDLATYGALCYAYSGLRDSLTVSTGKGKHIYCVAAEPVQTTSFNLNGMKHHVKAEGSQVVAPPSVHAATGRTYAFDDPGRAPIVLDLPRLRAALVRIGAAKSQLAPESGSRHERGWVAKALREGARMGERDELTFQLAAYFSRTLPPDVTLEILTTWAETKCQQPWGESDVAQKIRSAGRYERE